MSNKMSASPVWPAPQRPCDNQKKIDDIWPQNQRQRLDSANGNLRGRFLRRELQAGATGGIPSQGMAALHGYPALNPLVQS